MSLRTGTSEENWYCRKADWLFLAAFAVVGLYVFGVLYANYGSLNKWLVIGWAAPIFLLTGLTHPSVLIQVYIFLLPLESLLGIRAESSIAFSLMKPVGMLVFLAWVLGAIVEKTGLQDVDEMTAPALLAGLGVSSALWSYSMPDVALRIGVRLLMNVALFFMLYQWMDSRERILNAYKAYALGTVVSAVAALTVFGQMAHGRLSLYGANQGTFPVTLSAGILFWLYSAIHSRRLSTKLASFALFALVYAVALSSGTRGFMYVSFVIIPLFVYEMTRIRSVLSKNSAEILFKAPVLFILLVGFAGFLLWKFDFLTVVMNRAAMGFRGRAFAERVLAILYTPAALDYNALLGVGLGNYPYFLHDLVGDFREAHNVFVTCLQELGIVGLTIYGVLFWRLAKKAVDLYFRMDQKTFYVSVALYSFVIISLLSLSEPLLQKKVLWLAFAFIVSANLTVHREGKREDGR